MSIVRRPSHDRHRERRVRLDGDPDRRRRRRDERPAEQRVRADRHQQQRLDLRPDHRTAGRERVRRRAGRRGAHHAVAAVPGQRPPVDLDEHLEHPLAGALLDGHLVERPRPGDDLPVGLRGHVDGEPLVDGVRVRDDLAYGPVDVADLRLGEEADLAEVDAEQRAPWPGGPAPPRAAACRRRRARRRSRRRWPTACRSPVPHPGCAVRRPPRRAPARRSRRRADRPPRSARDRRCVACRCG